jgi:hypothetical protein
LLLHDGELVADIIGYEGLYAITSSGRVWGYAREIVGCGNRKKWLRPGAWQAPQKSGRGGKGYLQIGLSKDRMRKRFCIHKLIATAFIPNPRGLTEINHIDGDKLNNAIYNLEWCTHAENVEHAHRTGLRNGSSKYRGVSWNRHKNKWVAFTSERSVYTYVGQFDTEIEAARAYNSYVEKHRLPFVMNRIAA